MTNIRAPRYLEDTQDTNKLQTLESLEVWNGTSSDALLCSCLVAAERGLTLHSILSLKRVCRGFEAATGWTAQIESLGCNGLENHQANTSEPLSCRP